MNRGALVLLVLLVGCGGEVAFELEDASDDDAAADAPPDAGSDAPMDDVVDEPPLDAGVRRCVFIHAACGPAADGEACCADLWCSTASRCEVDL